jgi:hypothetical protein
VLTLAELEAAVPGAVDASGLKSGCGLNEAADVLPAALLASPPCWPVALTLSGTRMSDSLNLTVAAPDSRAASKDS